MVGAQLLQNLSLSDLDLLLQYIGLRKGDGRSLFGTLKEMGDQPIEAIEPAAPGIVNITINTGGTATINFNGVPEGVGRLLTNERVRNAVPNVVAPLATDGIDNFRTGSRTDPAVIVTKADVPRLQAPDNKRELADDVATTAVELLSPSFVDGNKWRVSQGGSPFWAQMLDHEFLAQIDRGERGFFKGDYLVVQMRTRAYATVTGISTEREIVEVVDYRRRSTQGSLL